MIYMVAWSDSLLLFFLEYVMMMKLELEVRNCPNGIHIDKVYVGKIVQNELVILNHVYILITHMSSR